MYTGYFVPWNTGTIYGCFVTNFLVGITLDNKQLFKPIKPVNWPHKTQFHHLKSTITIPHIIPFFRRRQTFRRQTWISRAGFWQDLTVHALCRTANTPQNADYGRNHELPHVRREAGGRETKQYFTEPFLPAICT